MRLVAVSKVLDEADIVEAFIRHTAALVDHHLVMDNGSQDGTLEILHQLAAEGIPLTIMQARSARFREDEYNTTLYRYAVQQLAADWALFLDADEFVDDRGEPGGLRAGLEAPGNRLVRMRNYLRTALDDAGEPVVPLRQQHGLPSMDVSKVFVDARLGVEDVVILRGSHQAQRDGQHLPQAAMPGVVLAHYPERSTSQAMVKLLRGWVKVMAGGPKTVASGANNHYSGAWEVIINNPPVIWDKNYSVHGLSNGGDFMHLAERDPPVYRGGPLRYTPPIDDPARYAGLMMRYVKDLAESHGRLVEGLPEPEDLLAVLHPIHSIVPIVNLTPEPEPEPAPVAVPARPRRSFFQRVTRR